jgi:hypothetical protein
MSEPIDMDGGTRYMMAVLVFCLVIYFLAKYLVPA